MRLLQLMVKPAVIQMAKNSTRTHAYRRREKETKGEEAEGGAFGARGSTLDEVVLVAAVAVVNIVGIKQLHKFWYT
jgi:hypothetical protein